MGQEYKLFYKDNFLGTVLTNRSDFPNISGQIEFNRDTLNKEKELRDYIGFSIESSDKVLGDGNVYANFIDKEGFKHQSIIDSLDWALISKDGTEAKILVPIFFADNEVNFRFQ
ncbi:MAG: hypothetical protein KA713_09920 [Chryseotalea sp. WA131a]|nr:MAG: hypothetical protein KA713_09920 [Chryseotalea sp. WA131a]